MVELIREYRSTLRMVQKSRKHSDDVNERSKLGNAASDLQYAIDYMETSRIPGNRYGITRMSTIRREIKFDPQSYQFVQKAVLQVKPVSELSPHQKELLDDLLDILTPKEKEAFELVRGQGYSFEEARQLLNQKSRGAIQTLVSRAEKKLQLVVQSRPNSEEILLKPLQRVMVL